MKVERVPRAVVHRLRTAARTVGRYARTEVDLRRSVTGAADLAVFHDFVPPPSGGGHQFLRALRGEIEGRGLTVESNRVSGGTRACLFNSFNFDMHRLRRFGGRDARMVHRVDGPIGLIRGNDDGSDRRIAAINDAVADATIFQSVFSKEAHEELGLELVAPVVIPNAPDPAIFHPPALPRERDDRLRVIATSWSDNPRKGAATLEWLDRSLDPTQYALTFVGRTPAELQTSTVCPPVDSVGLAGILREHDVFVAAGFDERCPNALLEALACGLPVVFRESGSHRELVGAGGLGFVADAEIPGLLDQVGADLAGYRSCISMLTLAEVADHYLATLFPDGATGAV